MGISDLSRYDTLVNGLMTQQAQLQQLTIEQGTGTSLQRPSDDPIGTSQLLGISLDLSAVTAYQQNVTTVQTNMNSEDSVETTVGQLLSSAKAIAQGVAAAPPGDPSRTGAITQLSQLLQQIVDLANTQVGDSFIFGGQTTNQPPIQATAPGTAAVLGTSLDPTVATATAAGTTAVGRYQLTSDASGNVTLTNTSNPAQTETVTGVTNATPSISFATLGVTITAGAGFTVAGLNGATLAVASGYAYKGDGIRPQVTVDTGVTVQTNHTGDQVFGSTIAALQGTIGALQTGSTADIATAATQLAQAQTQVLTIQSDGGVTLQQLKTITAAQATRQTTLGIQRSSIDSVSQDQVAAQLLSVQTALQAAYAVTGRLESLSLANYLPASG